MATEVPPAAWVVADYCRLWSDNSDPRYLCQRIFGELKGWIFGPVPSLSDAVVFDIPTPVGLLMSYATEISIRSRTDSIAVIELSTTAYGGGDEIWENVHRWLCGEKWLSRDWFESNPLLTAGTEGVKL